MPSLPRPRPTAVRALLALQLTALLVLGGVTAARFHVWAEIDERQHYDYVQRVATGFQLPRPTDLVTPEVQAITDRTWPRPSPTDRASVGLAGRSYEAIQPPLYYVVAAPAFLAVGDYRDKVFAVRAFDLALLAVTLTLLWRLALAFGPRRAAGPAFAVVLAVALWPGEVVRATTIGNTPLELALTAAFLLALWRADGDRRTRPLAVAAVLLGLCLLTKLSLIALVPVFLVVGARRLRRGAGSRATTLALTALPVVLLAPWIASNYDRYGTPTVNITGTGGVVAAPSSSGALDRLGDLPGLNWRLVEGVLPQEFRFQLDVWWVHAVVVVLALALLAGAVALVAARSWRMWFLALPFVSTVALMNVTFVLTGNDTFLLRYAYATLLPLALGVGLLTARHRRTALATAAIPSLLAVALWVDMFGAYYFTNVGAKLGI